MTLLSFETFNSHSGLQLPFKIDCDTLTDDDFASLAKIVTNKFLFSRVVGIPRGGLRFAEVLRSYCVEGYPELIVDDVLTTGSSMQEWRETIPGPAVGVVIFARGPCPNWVWPIFILQDWTQSRGTGVG